MIRTTAVRRALLLGTATATLLVAAACGDTAGMNHDGTNVASTPRPGASASTANVHNDADVAFAQMMIPHHQQAVEMATVAETRASDPQIKQIAAKIKAAQSPEINTMTGWLTAWGMPTTPAGGHNMPGMSNTAAMPGMMSDTEMAQLNAATGAEFDRMFARMMIAHHNGAIQSAHDEQANGTNVNAKELAAAIAQSQTTEVATLQAIVDRL